MAGQPGLPGSQFPSEDALIRRIQDLEKTVQQLAAANPFAPMGMTPGANGVTFDGSVVVNGNLAVPNGSITNAALQNPVTGLVVNGSADTFGLPASTAPMATVITQTVTVPNGFTTAHVNAYASLVATNPLSTATYCYVRVKIAGAGPAYLGSDYTQPSQSSYCGSSYARTLTGISGSFSITVEVGADSTAWASNVINNALLSATVTFLR